MCVFYSSNMLTLINRGILYGFLFAYTYNIQWAILTGCGGFIFAHPHVINRRKYTTNKSTEFIQLRILNINNIIRLLIISA